MLDAEEISILRKFVNEIIEIIYEVKDRIENGNIPWATVAKRLIVARDDMEQLKECPQDLVDRALAKTAWEDTVALIDSFPSVSDPKELLQGLSKVKQLLNTLDTNLFLKNRAPSPPK